MLLLFYTYFYYYYCTEYIILTNIITTITVLYTYYYTTTITYYYYLLLLLLLTTTTITYYILLLLLTTTSTIQVNFELVSERDTILKLRTLVQTKNTKLAQLKKKLIELNLAAQQHAAKVVEEVNIRKNLLNTIEHYKKNLIEREEALAEKEKDVLELRSTTRTLENFRFVLDHRLQQLSSERGPITNHIESLEKHISTMYEELVEEFNIKKINNESYNLQEQKIQWLSLDLNKIRQNVREKEQYITAFKRELNNIMSSMVVGKELEESIKLLYKKFVRGEAESKTFVKIGDHIMDKVGDLLYNNNENDDHSVLSIDTIGKLYITFLYYRESGFYCG